MPANAPTALVIGPVRSPYFDELKKSVRTVQYTGTQHVADHDLIIFDGDAQMPTAVKANPLVDEALRTGKWVMGVDLRSAHKQQGLAELLHTYTCGDSGAYAVRVGRDQGGHFEAWVLEPDLRLSPSGQAPSGVSGDCPTSSALAVQAARDPQVSGFVSMLVPKLSSPWQGTAQATPTREPVYATFNYQTSNVGTITSGHWTQGKQTPGYTANHQVIVYLDDKNNPQGNYQYVSVSTDVEASPKLPSETFIGMNYRGSGDWTYNYAEMGWFQDAVLVQQKVPDGWSRVGTSPETENNETEVETGVDFSVGVGPEGPDADVGIKNSVTRVLKDWKVYNESPSTNDRIAQWNYHSNYPYDADFPYGDACTTDQEFYQVPSCFIGDAPNDLSLQTLSLATQAVWRTPALLTGLQPMTFLVGQRLADVYCTKPGGLFCYGADASFTTPSGRPDELTVWLDVGAVLPVPLSAITFTPNPVPAGQSVTGTVVLARPAPIDISIPLASNVVNATVLPTVTVKQGQSTATFQVLTNGNGLAPGASTVATISTPYGAGFQAQLKIQN